ncbi:Uncharacterised protein at_DN1662 [Pycnogonum litorale]
MESLGNNIILLIAVVASIVDLVQTKGGRATYGGGRFGPRGDSNLKRSTGLSVWAVVGLSLGGILGISLLFFCCIYIFATCKQSRNRNKPNANSQSNREVPPTDNTQYNPRLEYYRIMMPHAPRTISEQYYNHIATQNVQMYSPYSHVRHL